MKIVFALLTIFGLFWASLASAQISTGIDEETLKALRAEAPLAQADIDAVIKMLPRLGTAVSDPATLQNVYQEVGLSEVRATFVLSKVSLAMALAMGTEAKDLPLQNTPDIMRPNDNDVALVKKNLEALNQAVASMYQAMGTN